MSDLGKWMISLVGLVMASIVAMNIQAKRNVCKTYYPELAAWSCLISDYGLPARGGK